MKKLLYITLFILLLSQIGWSQNNNLPSLQFKNLNLLQLQIAPRLRVYLTEDEYKKYTQEGAKEFTEQINKAINLLSSQNMPYPKEGSYQIVVLPQGEVFKNISGVPWTYGINGIDGWPQALAFDDSRFFNLNPNTYFIGLVHELAHLIHGDWLDIYPICEGFAEAVPFYILNLTDEKQRQIALNLKPKQISSVDKLIKRGMFLPEEDYSKAGRVQYLKTYISMYLWMRGYLIKVQEKYNFDKLQALNFVLQEFKAAGALPTLKEQENYIANLIGWKRKKVFDRADLQLIGQKSLSRELEN